MLPSEVGIGVAPVSSDIRGYLEDDMAHDGVAQRVCFVEPVDARTPETLMKALHAELAP